MHKSSCSIVHQNVSNGQVNSCFQWCKESANMWHGDNVYICIHGYLRNTLSIQLSLNKAPPSDETVFESIVKQNKNKNNFMLLSQSQQTTI